MFKKKFMKLKHLKLRTVAKTMFLTTAIMCGVAAGSTTAKAEATVTPTPTPLPNVNVVLSLNSYETDDRDYAKSYVTNDVFLMHSQSFSSNSSSMTSKSYNSLTSGLHPLYSVKQEGSGNSIYTVKYPKFYINNFTTLSCQYSHTASDEIGTYLLCEDEGNSGYTKEVSFDLSYMASNNGNTYSYIVNEEYEGIHLGIPSDLIFLSGKTDPIDFERNSTTIILEKDYNYSLVDEKGSGYAGTTYTVVDNVRNNPQTHLRFVTDLRLTDPSVSIKSEGSATTGIWTTPEKVTDSDGNSYDVIGIGSSSFTCEQIKKVNISKNIRFIDSSAFFNKTSLKEVSFEAPENITYIGYKAFSGSAIETIDLTGLLRSEDGCSLLCRNIFENCTNLKTVILNNTGKSLEQAYLPSRLFKNCSALSTVEWGDIKNIQIGDETFLGTNLLNIEFPADTKVQIGQYAFKGCTNLANVDIAGECELQEGAFYGCFKEEEGSATFGASVELGGYAFAECTNLTSVDFKSEKQSGFSSCITATPIPTATAAPTLTPKVTAIPSITATPEPTKIPVNLEYGETTDGYLSSHPSWYEDYYKKNPEGYVFITATPTPNPNVTVTPTPAPVQEVKKGDTITLYKECFRNTGITSVIINADHINLHMECLGGMKLSTLKLGGTILNTYGNLLNETDELKDIIISSTQVLFLNDIDDTCYIHYKPSYEGECSDGSGYSKFQANYNSSQNMGAFTMSQDYVNLIFTKDVELISGDYSGTIANATNNTLDAACLEKTKYFDKISNIYFLNPNIRFVTGTGITNKSDYCGLKGCLHLHAKQGKQINVYGYDFSQVKIDSNIIGTSFYYPVTDDEEKLDDIGYNTYVAKDGFLQYIDICENKDNFIYMNIQDVLTAEYESGTAVVGTKFDPSKLVVKQTYNSSLANAENYTVILQNEGMTTGSIVGSTGFRYSIPAGVVDDEGNFKMPDSQNSSNVQITVYHGKQQATVTINILAKNASSYEVEYPTLIAGKTLKLEDFKIKNLVFNDGEKIDTTDLDKLAEKYDIKVAFMDALNNPLAYIGSSEELAKSYKIEKQLSKVSVTIINNSKSKENILVLDEAPEELNVTLKDTSHVFYENDKSTDLKNLFEVKVINNNGTTSENVLENKDYTITEETLKAGENTLHFVYTNAKGEAAEGTYTLNAAEEYPVKFFSISTMYENMGIVENSIIDMNTFDISMELNSGRTRKLSSEEKAQHCTIAGKLDIVAGQYSNVTIQYKDAERNIDVSSNATVLGIGKEIAKLSACEKTSVSSETPAKTWYVGDTITKDDITVIGYYNNGTEKEDDYKNYTIENPVLSGTTNTIVIYRTDKKEVKTELEINAVMPSLLRIEATYNGNKQIPEGSEINKDDLVVKAIYDNREAVLANDEYTLEYQILNNKECTVTVWFNKMKAEFKVEGTAPVATAAPTTAPTSTAAPTTAPTSTAAPTVQEKKQTFKYSFSNKKIKLVDTKKKTTYKTVLKKKLTIKASLTDGKVYYQIVKSGKKVSSKNWKTLNKSVVIKTNGKMSVYIKYTLNNGKTIQKKTTGFVLDTKAPTVKVAKTGKITVKDSVSGIKSIKDGKKTIKNNSVLSKGVHKITVTDKAGNKKTVKVTIR